MYTIKGYTELKIDGMYVVLLTSSYAGSPMICHSPDMLIIPEWIFNKYSETSFRIDYTKTKVVKI